MEEETFKVAQKVHDDIYFFTEGRKIILEYAIVPSLPNRVRDYLLECLDKKLYELKNEFKQL